MAIQQHQFDQQVSDLGFGWELATTNNFPEGFVTADQLDEERKLNRELIKDSGVRI